MAYCTLLIAACIVSTAQPQPAVMKDQPPEVLFKEAAPATLECVLEGDVQEVTYSWRKDGLPFIPKDDVIQRPNEGTLNFTTPKPSDEGEYQCFAHSHFGTASTALISFRRVYILAPKLVPQTHEPAEGSPYTLDCSLPEAYPEPKITWMIQEGGITKPLLSVRAHSPNGPLFFSNVTKEDLGVKYLCVASTEFGDVVLAEHLMRRLAPAQPGGGQLVPQYLSSDIVAKVGSVTEVWCIYGGTPLAYPDWTKDGTNVDGGADTWRTDRVTKYNWTSGRRLLIKETRPGDAGEYRCSARSGTSAAEHRVNLTVVSAPTFQNPRPIAFTVKKGDSVTIPCLAQGNPAPSVTLYQNARPIPRASVSLSEVSEKDQGYYGCMARNQHGVAYAEILVIVQ